MIIPNIWKNKSHVPVTTNQLSIVLHRYISLEICRLPAGCWYIVPISDYLLAFVVRQKNRQNVSSIARDRNSTKCRHIYYHIFIDTYHYIPIEIFKSVRDHLVCSPVSVAWRGSKRLTPGSRSSCREELASVGALESRSNSRHSVGSTKRVLGSEWYPLIMTI